MIIELSDRYAQCVVRSLKDREEGLADDLECYKGCDIGDAIEEELHEIRAVKDYLEEKLLQQ